MIVADQEGLSPKNYRKYNIRYNDIHNSISLVDDYYMIKEVLTRRLKKIQQETGMAILLISHNLAVVSEMADEISVMYLGKQVEYGQTDSIFENPLHPYTKGLWNSIPKIEGPIERLVPISGIVPSPRDLPLGCVFSTRCSEFMEGRCNSPKPVPRIEVESEHYVNCYLYERKYNRIIY